ncbi:thiol reductant ABC exporter subunit CydC [Oryzihumus sp.]
MTRSTPPILRAGLIGAAATASGIALTATSGWLIVSASARPVILTLLTAIVAVRAFGIARPAFRYLERLRSHDAALGDLAERRTRTYRRLVPLTPARLGRRGRSEVLTGAVRDLDDEVDAQVRVTVPVLSALLAASVAAALTVLVLPDAGAVVATQVGLAGLLAAGLWRAERSTYAVSLRARAEVARVSALVSGNALELQAVGGTEQANRWLAAAHEDLVRATTRQGRVRSVGVGSLLLLTAGATVASAVLAARADLAGPVAALLVVTPLAVGDALAVLPDAMSARARSLAAAERLQALLEQEPAVRDSGDWPVPTADGAVPGLRLRRLTAAWAGDRPQLGPLDLDLEPGEHVAVVGPNGSGKSTLLAVLARALDPRSGRYELDGDDVRGLDLEQTRALFAVVDDTPHVFASSLRENLRLARPGCGDDEIGVALLDAGLGHWLAGLPEGLDTVLGAGGRGVSGGERARLGIARALLSGRPVLLLDEPVAHLDHPTAEAVVSDLLDASRGRTVVMVSHRLDSLDGFDRVVDLGGTTHRAEVGS